jgi:hypothetical protein
MSSLGPLHPQALKKMHWYDKGYWPFSSDLLGSYKLQPTLPRYQLSGYGDGYH